MSEQNVKPAFLANVADGWEFALVESILSEHKIPFMKQHSCTGGVMSVLGGSSLYGVDIYVPSNALDKAKELVEAGFANAEDDDGEEVSWDDEDTDPEL